MTFPNVDSDAQPSLVGVRVESCDDLHRGTVRYHGPIPAGGGALWLGVEWDDPRRGKHSGNGLFSVKVPGSASFVRVPKGPSPRMRLPQTVMAAVREKYLSSFDRETPAERETDRSSGLHARRPGEDVTVEMVGWNKTRKMQSKLSQIKILGLAGMQVGHVNEAVIYFSGVPKETVDADQAPGAIREALSVVEDIDLSRNLLSTWQEVAVIVGQLDSLESLRLNNNRLQILQDLSPLTGVFNKISILALATTFIAWNDIETLAEFFPNLKALHFGFNNLTSVATKKEDAPLFPALESLHLEDNSLISWKEMVHFAQMHTPNLRWLNVSNNNFTEIDSVSDANPAQMANLAVLNISGNKISEFTSLHALNSFPSLVEIRVKGNPFFALQPPTKLSGFDAVNSKADCQKPRVSMAPK
ncbi:hypothetical protein HDU84_006412 [Entophlyctis sp. JEL0112]|nr:hypothetical protein HDU84_006412 [Entophlyctis sp. JEL0112]